MVTGDDMSITHEDYDMLGKVDRILLNKLFSCGFVTKEDVIEGMKKSINEYAVVEYFIDEDELDMFCKQILMELHQRFVENVEVPLFVPFNKEPKKFDLHPDAKWVLEQIMQEEYDENGEVVAKVLPNFDMEEYQ
jgi:hypothetical protein